MILPAPCAQATLAFCLFLGCVKVVLPEGLYAASHFLCLECSSNGGTGVCPNITSLERTLNTLVKAAAVYLQFGRFPPRPFILFQFFTMSCLSLTRSCFPLFLCLYGAYF